MMRISTLVVSALIPFLSPATAAREWPFEVAQPFFTENGFFIANATYVLDYGAPLPCLQVSYTCRENRVLTGRNEYQNRNAASVLGIEVRCESSPRTVVTPDTLRVTLDVSRADTANMRRGWNGPFVVQAVVECILINASRAFPRPAHVRLRIEGATELEHLAKTYPVAEPDRAEPRKFGGL